MSKRKLGILVLSLGMVIGLLPFLAGYYVDDLHTDPLYWLRFEFSPEFKKTVILDDNEPDGALVTLSFTKGNSGVFMDAELFSGTNRQGRLGGDENTFLGFHDVDGDGTREALFTSTLGYGSGGAVWAFRDRTWKEIPMNSAARQRLRFAATLFRAPLLLFLACVAIVLGLLLLTAGSRTSPE